MRTSMRSPAGVNMFTRVVDAEEVDLVRDKVPDARLGDPDAAGDLGLGQAAAINVGDQSGRPAVYRPSARNSCRPNPPRQNDNGPPSDLPATRSRTRPTTIQWSPAAWAVSSWHSMWANAPATSGAPVTGPGDQVSVANLFASLVASIRQIST